MAVIKMADSRKVGGPFRFRVSDALDVPNRGRLLRLRLLEGAPSMKELGKGKRLRIASPAGDERVVTIRAHSATGGRATQERLDTTHELDVVVSNEDGGTGEGAIATGWTAHGPVNGAD